jgi:hypothetical protein
MTEDSGTERIVRRSTEGSGAETEALTNAEEVVPTTRKTPKCSVRGCKGFASILLNCDCDTCGKNVHMECYQDFVLKQKKGGFLVHLPDAKVACTKICYQAVLKSVSSALESGRGTWNSDGRQGPNDPHTSMKMLLDWILEEGNYSRYRGKSNNGVKKQHVCTMLAVKMEQETKSSRNAKQVMSKIDYLEKSFKVAHNFSTSETGTGIEKDNGLETFKQAVLKKCPYYYELTAIMADRSATQPRLTNLDPGDLDVSTSEDDQWNDDVLGEEGEIENSINGSDGEALEEVNAGDDDMSKVADPSYEERSDVTDSSDSDSDNVQVVAPPRKRRSSPLRCSPRHSVPCVVSEKSGPKDDSSRLDSSKKSKRR